MKQVKWMSLLLLLAVVSMAVVGCKEKEKEEPKPSATGIEVSPKDTILQVGATMQLQVKVTPNTMQCTYESSRPAVASVDANGLVTALEVGRANVQVACGTLKQQCRVEVIPQVESFVIKNGVDTLEIRVGASGTLINGIVDLEVKPAELLDYMEYTIDNGAIGRLSLNEDGDIKFEARSEGVANIVITLPGEELKLPVKVVDNSNSAFSKPVIIAGKRGVTKFNYKDMFGDSTAYFEAESGTFVFNNFVTTDTISALLSYGSATGIRKVEFKGENEVGVCDYLVTGSIADSLVISGTIACDTAMCLFVNQRPVGRCILDGLNLKVAKPSLLYVQNGMEWLMTIKESTVKNAFFASFGIKDFKIENSDLEFFKPSSSGSGFALMVNNGETEFSQCASLTGTPIYYEGQSAPGVQVERPTMVQSGIMLNSLPYLRIINKN